VVLLEDNAPWDVTREILQILLDYSLRLYFAPSGSSSYITFVGIDIYEGDEKVSECRKYS
jgi:hypothetical protein